LKELGYHGSLRRPALREVGSTILLSSFRVSKSFDDEEISPQEEDEVEDKQFPEMMKLAAANLAQLALKERKQEEENEVGFEEGVAKR
tara:strand:- start:195 stop:458 length:264 start_codon:yes stop_codon:yes gene_type:complete